MNYYNPYYMMYPMTSMARPGLFSAIRTGLRGINFGSILNGTQRTLGIVNQAIPLVKQVTPVMRNAKTMFKVMNEFKKTDTPKPVNNGYNQNSYSNNTNNYSSTSNNYDEVSEYEEGPTFFV